MPIYEYECTSCHHHFDFLQKVNEAPIKQCPECSKDTVIRLVSAAGFQLKGSGWYATDFKPQKEKPGAAEQKKSENNKATDSATSTTSKGDTE